jgi:curved DNA-binding protein CbpA
MDTLYDLLGALPRDDAEDLRTAFRIAVKGTHPDVRPGDPDAGLKFRQIVRANEILRDPEQRAAYDHLLELARLEQESASGHFIAARIRKLAAGVIAVAGASAAMVGGYLLFMHMSAASVARANNVDFTMRASPEIVAVSPARSPDTTDNSASPAKRESTSIPGEAIVPNAAMLRTTAESIPAANVGPAPDGAASEAISLRARGISAYRSGDLDRAIADLDQAIQLEPRFLPAYIDRAIIFFRQRKSGPAFPDIAEAKRVEKASPSKSAPTIAMKPHYVQAATAPSATSLPQQKTAEQDPSRSEGAAPLRVR